jgi:hypothetical protein
MLGIFQWNCDLPDLTRVENPEQELWQNIQERTCDSIGGTELE